MNAEAGEVKQDAPDLVVCFCATLGAYGVRLQPYELSEQFGVSWAEFDQRQVRTIAHSLGIRTSVVRSNTFRLRAQPLPAIAELRDGWVVIAKIDATHAYIGRPNYAKALQQLTLEDFSSAWLGKVILFRRESQGATTGFRWFSYSVFKYKKELFEVLLISAVLQVLALAAPLFTQVAIDKVLAHKNISTLTVLGCGMIVVSVFEGVLTVLQTYLLTHTTNRIDAMLGSKIFGHLLSIPLSYFEARKVGDSVARVREIENIRQFVTGSSMSSLLDIVFVAILLVVMVSYSVKLTCIVLMLVPVFACVAFVARPLVRRFLNARFDAGSQNQSLLVEAVTGIHTVKSLDVQQQLKSRWDATLASYLAASFHASMVSGVAGASAQLANKAATLALFWVGAYDVMSGQLSVGQLIAFQMLAARVTGPIVRLMQLTQDFQQISVSVERVNDLLRASPEYSPAQPTSLPPQSVGKVVFSNVSFSYGGGRSVAVQDINFSLEPGKILGIVGRSGSGKSTLTKLLQRLYLPTRGSILIGGVDITRLSYSNLRRRIGVVMQDTFLFHGTIAENISIQFEKCDQARVERAAKLAGAHSFISAMPEGYETLVGERGVALSGGQRQRLAIARALITEPSILIFDEATSALDLESEREIQLGLKAALEGRTVIVVAHRPSAVLGADNIIVLEGGKIAGSGTFDELSSSCGVFQDLFVG